VFRDRFSDPHRGALSRVLPLRSRACNRQPTHDAVFTAGNEFSTIRPDATALFWGAIALMFLNLGSSAGAPPRRAWLHGTRLHQISQGPRDVRLNPQNVGPIVGSQGGAMNRAMRVISSLKRL
jgi:hypothetical protein